MSSHLSAIAIFNTLQRETLTAIVDTFVAAVPSENDPDGFYAAKGSDVGADIATEQYLSTHLPEEQLAGLLRLIDAAGLFGLKDQPQAGREEIIANLAGISPEAAGVIAALQQLSVLFAYSLQGPRGRNPLWVGMEYPGPAQTPPADARKTLEVITPSGETTLESDVVVIGSGSGGGVTAAALAQAGKRVIILEAGSYWNESDFVQSEPLAYQKLFLRGGFFPSADGMVSIAAGSTVGGGSTVNWSNSLLTPNTVRASWANDLGSPTSTPRRSMNTYRRSSTGSNATTRSPPRMAPISGCGTVRPSSGTRTGSPRSTSTRRNTTPT
jgi:hypothetical protein